MYHIAFPQISNRQSWSFTGLITDLSGNPLDLTALSLVFAVRDRDRCTKLLASTDNGKLTVLGLGLFCWAFSVDEMRSLCRDVYDTGFTMASDTQTAQVSVGPLTIIDGIMP